MLELPWKVRCRAFREMFLGRLGHRFPTIRGERITTVKRDMRRQDELTGQARAAAFVDVGIRLPAPIRGV